MSKKYPKIVYDRESRVLSFEVSPAKSVDSDVEGNVVIDYDKQGKIVRIDLYEFRFDAFRSTRKAVKEFARHSKVPLLVR